MARVRAFLAVSLDGFLAGPDDDLDWLDGHDGADDTFSPFFAQIGALLMGRRTFDVVHGMGGPWPYGETPVLVATHRALPDPPPGADVRAVEGAIEDLLAVAVAAASARGRDVYVDGGTLVRSVLAAGRLDELTVTVVPVVLGAGVRLFGPADAPVALELERVHDLGAGLAQLTYRLES